MVTRETVRWVLALAAAVGCVHAAAEEPLAKIDMAALPADRIVSGEASEPKEVDGVTCRLIRGGRACAISVDRWWGQTVRPPAKTM